MAEASIPPENLVKSEKVNVKKSSGEVFEDARKRAVPVLKTVVGGVALAGAAFLTKASLHELSNNFMSDWAMTIALRVQMLAPATGLAVGGVLSAKEPVKDAFRFMKDKLQKKQ